MSSAGGDDNRVSLATTAAPAKNFRNFSAYTFSVTPLTHVVYQIQAVSPLAATLELQDDEWTRIKRALMKKFKKTAARENSATNYELVFPGTESTDGRRILVSRTDVSMTITAVDQNLRAQAEKEQTQAATARVTPTTEDLDAL